MGHSTRLTSNKGSADFQHMQENGETLFERVMRRTAAWGDTGNTMFVVGATHPEAFAGIRKIIPDHFLLVPGVGAQGGRSSCSGSVRFEYRWWFTDQFNT